MKYVFSLLILYPILFSSCSFKGIRKYKNNVYDSEHGLKLDVYTPKKVDKPKEVLVFIHGGNWTSGKKSLYRFFGKGMAKKGIVSVIIDYRLSPLTNNNGMAMDASMALAWVKKNINTYNGDTNRIFISGHSAGAQLAALIALDDRYFNTLNIKNPIKGIVLIDAFGLDMCTYLSTSQNKKDSIYYLIFSKDPETWKKNSPTSYLKKEIPPVLLFLGGKTYPAITKGTYDFLKALQPYQPNTKLIYVRGKRHAGMIFQFLNAHNNSYTSILDFIQ